MKKKRTFAAIFNAVVVLLTCGAMGALAAREGCLGSPDDMTGFLLRYAGFLLVWLVTYLLAVILHEAGHLVFGLLTGYLFCSFRAGPVMLQRTEDGLALKRFRMHGTGGQCLLEPPPWREEGFPCILYNLGGVLMNLLCVAVSVPLWLACPRGSFGSLIFICMGLQHLMAAILNGVPLRTGYVDNDGMNVRTLCGSKAARKSFWRSMMITAALSRGESVEEMPEEWFIAPETADLRQPFEAVEAGTAAVRLLLRGDHAAVRQLQDRLLAPDSALSGINRCSVMLDRMYLDILEKGPEADISVLTEALASGRAQKPRAGADPAEEDRKLLRGFVRAMRKDSTSVLRVRYAAACRVTGDAAEKAAVKEAFEALAAGYPYPGDIAAERRLMAAAEAPQPGTQTVQ